MEIDFTTIMEFVIPILTIILGFSSACFKENEKLRNAAIKYIAEAEKMYEDISKSGVSKFAWVVDILYNLVPVPLRFIFTKTVIEIIVQSTFDGIETYAKTQLNNGENQILENFLGNDDKK